MSAFRVWQESDVVWEWTFCEAPGCLTPAVLLADHADGSGVPLCLDDAETLLERQLVADRELLRTLSDPWERYRPLPRPRPRRSSEWELADPDRPELGTIAEQSPERWLALKGYYGVEKQRQAGRRSGLGLPGGVGMIWPGIDRDRACMCCFHLERTAQFLRELARLERLHASLGERRQLLEAVRIHLRIARGSLNAVGWESRRP